MYEEPKIPTMEDLRKGWQNNIDIYVSIANTTFSRSELSDLFLKLLFFKPTRMEISKQSYGGSRRYNKDLFKDAMFDNNNKHFGLYNTGASRIDTSVFSNATLIHIRIDLQTFENQKQKIFGALDRFFVTLNGCFAFVVNSFDYNIVQNPSYVKDYITYGVNESDFLGLSEVPVIPSDDPALDDKLDLSYLPGSRLEYNNMIFTTAPYMWFGPDFSNVFSEFELQNFDNCVENTEYAPGYRKICLWQNISEYNHPTLRVRQRLLRDALQMDNTVNRLNQEPNNQQDPQIEFFTGKFAHGGTLLAKFYVDKKGKSCSKSIAEFAISREMQGNTVVWEEKIKNPR